MVARVMLAGLLKIELPDHTVLLTDGGTVPFDGDSYVSRDSLFGVIDSVEPISEGVGDEAPAFTISFRPDPDAPAGDLNSPDYQGCRLRMWIAEIIDDDSEDAGTIDGDPDLIVDAIIDVPRLRFPEDGRVLEVDCVSVWQRLLDRSEGNLLNGVAHKRIYPAEQGLDNTTGVGRTVAWGTKSAPRGLGGGGGGGGGGGSGGYVDQY